MSCELLTTAPGSKAPRPSAHFLGASLAVEGSPYADKVPARRTSGKLNLALDRIGARGCTNDISAKRQNKESCNNLSHKCLATAAYLVESDCRVLKTLLSIKELGIQLKRSASWRSSSITPVRKNRSDLEFSRENYGTRWSQKRWRGRACTGPVALGRFPKKVELAADHEFFGTFAERGLSYFSNSRGAPAKSLAMKWVPGSKVNLISKWRRTRIACSSSCIRSDQAVMAPKRQHLRAPPMMLSNSLFASAPLYRCTSGAC